MGSQTDKKNNNNTNNYKLKKMENKNQTTKNKQSKATKDFCIPIHSDSPPKAQSLPEIQNPSKLLHEFAHVQRMYTWKDDYFFIFFFVKHNN
jgi:hypothetical protein